MLQLDDKEPKAIKQIGIYMTIPFVLAIPPVLGWFIGSWLDEKLGSASFFMYFFIVLGFVAGFRELYRIIKRFGNGA